MDAEGGNRGEIGVRHIPIYGCDRSSGEGHVALNCPCPRPDVAARDWLNKSDEEAEGVDEQLRLHEAESQCVGVFAVDNGYRPENARHDLRQLPRPDNGR